MKPALQKRQSSGTVLTLVSSQPEPAEAAPKPVRRLRRLLFWVLAPLGLAAALVVTGLAIYEQTQAKMVNRRLHEARLLAEVDTPLALRRSLEILDNLRKIRPRDDRIKMARAEVLSFLWGRFEGSDAARSEARMALEEARAVDPDGERVTALRGYHLLYEGRWAEAARLAESGLLSHQRSARLGHVLGMARQALGELTAASATLRLATSQDPQFHPAWAALARVQRLLGQREAAALSIQHILTRNPRHFEAQLEQTLLRLSEGKTEDPAVPHQLARQASPYPPLLAVARLALARQALLDGELGRARTLLQQAALVAPEDPEIGLALVESRLGPGGDAREGWTLKGVFRDRTREVPHSPAVFAEVALAVGRPDQAIRLLSRSLTANLPDGVRDRERALRVHAAWELDQPEVADRLCRELWEGGMTAPLSTDACLVQAARLRQVKVLQKQTKNLEGRLKDLALAFVHYAQHSDQEVVVALSPLARHPRTSAWTLLILADSLQRLERPSAALPFLEQAVHQDARSVRSRLALLKGRLVASWGAKTLPQWNELLNERSFGARTLLDIGLLGLKLGRHEAVRSLAARMERIHRTSGHAAYLHGLSRLLEERDRRQARARFEAAQMREPGHLPSKLALAKLAFERGDVDGGRQLLDEAFELSGHSPEVTLTLARELFLRNRIEQARAAFVKAALQFRVLGSPYRASETLAELGNRLSEIKAYRHRSVLRILRWALQISDQPARAHLRLGQFLQGRGKLEEALRCYRRATRLGPELADGFYQLGELLMSTRADPELAEHSLARYLDLTRSPQGKRAVNAQAWIVRLQARRKYFAAKPGR